MRRLVILAFVLAGCAEGAAPAPAQPTTVVVGGAPSASGSASPYVVSDAGAESAGYEDAGPVDPDALAAEIAASIVVVSPTERRIPRSSMRRLFDHQDILFRQVRMVPEQSNGKPVGIRLFGIRADSLFARLGFENGDRVQSLDGDQVDGTSDAPLLNLRNARTIVIGIVRKGQPLTLTLIVE